MKRFGRTAASGPARYGVDCWVADADVAAEAAEREGGSVLAAPAEAGPFHTATLADPGGAAFSLSQLLARVGTPAGITRAP